jgi:malonyl-CoA O-methyltransferase
LKRSAIAGLLSSFKRQTAEKITSQKSQIMTARSIMTCEHIMKAKTQICKSFSRSAEHYEKNAFVQREIGERMMERLAYLTMKPRLILDLGCGTGLFAEKLSKLYPDALVIASDISLNMLHQAQKKPDVHKQRGLVQADFMQLPFEDAVFDLIFSNQVIHWASDMGGLFKELHRVLKPSGCFFFSTLGPSTFKELNAAWRSADPYAHAHAFVDMHEVGDALLRASFLDPVIDREDLSVHFSSLNALLLSLKDQGVCNVNPKRSTGLTTPAVFKRFVAAFTNCLTETGEAPLTYEIVQGHAWKGQSHHGERGHEVFMSIRHPLDIL